ncbi:MAG: hypothetical protein EOP84_16955 [Verrucomicrobiaceae bacterium]|nr:MAG: hypothetical protein EOP84_16955 [Verrucomicrobiaceae bacterium]
MKSPFTGTEIEPLGDFSGLEATAFSEEAVLGRWATTKRLLVNLGEDRLSVDGHPLTQREYRRVVALARSKAWIANKESQKPALFLFGDERSKLIDSGAATTKDYAAWQLLTVKELHSEAQRLTLPQRALRTLYNLSLMERWWGSGIDLAVNYVGDWSAAAATNELVDVRPVAYGAIGQEWGTILEFLIQEGYILFKHMGKPNTKITPKGYVKVEEITRGISALRRTFMVCRFTSLMDKLYDEVYKPVGLELQCPVLRVKDIHHVDRIDDKIVQEIRASSIVAVDLTDHNFNVAFEAGYALALDKPIVWAQRKSEGELKLPFDIQAQNIMFWREDDLAGFRERLKYRMIAALEKARPSGFDIFTS